MDTGSSATARNSLSTEYKLPSIASAENDLIVGVVTEAETSLFNETTLMNVQTGEKDNFLLLIKNSAGFLVGRMVVFDKRCSFVRWIENEMYTFKVLAPVKYPKNFEFDGDEMVQCPECPVQTKAKNLAKHFRKKHGFMML